MGDNKVTPVATNSEAQSPEPTSSQVQSQEVPSQAPNGQEVPSQEANGQGATHSQAKSPETKSSKDKNSKSKSKKTKPQEIKSPEIKRYHGTEAGVQEKKKMSFGTEAFKGQKYGKLKKDCLKKGELFVDTEFPANNKSLFFSKVDSEIVWKRPNELCKVPKLVVEGATCDDLNEGELGNAWFVAACSGLTQEVKMFQKVVPDVKEQDWKLEEGTYAGIFHFQFWRYGRWLDIVVDDLLPTKNNKLVFCHSKSRNEFWSALLEKAYAKLYGDYESLTQGYTADALVDFTGGVAEKLLVKEMDMSDTEQEAFFKDLKEAVENKSLATCCIQCGREAIGQEAEQGLVKGHAYGITNVKDIAVAKSLHGTVGKTLRLVRLRNPWGTREWTGPWSDESQEWNSLTLRDREKMGIRFEHDGEFWMSFTDFVTHFTNIDICHFVNTSFFSLKKTWTESLLHGEWSLGARGTDKDRAGGNAEHGSFLFNPQYVFDVPGIQDTLLVSLEQDDAAVNKDVGQDHREIGFHIMKVQDNRKYRVHIPGDKMVESEYKASRSIFAKVKLSKGRYVIVPSSKEPNVVGKFLLRVYTTSTANARPLLKEAPKPGMPCVKAPCLVTSVVIKKAVGIEKKQGVRSMDARVIVKCEGETVKSLPVPNTDAPEFNFKCIFYRKKPSLEHITIEVQNNNMMVNDFAGLGKLEDWGNDETKSVELELFGKKKKELELQYPGKLFIEVSSSEDLTAL